MTTIEQLTQARSDLAAAQAEIAALNEHLNRLRDERGQAQAELAKVRADLGAVFAQPAADAECWIEWQGGECPVEHVEPVRVEAVLRDGTIHRCPANQLRWSHVEPGAYWHACDIVRAASETLKD